MSVIRLLTLLPKICQLGFKSLLFSLLHWIASEHIYSFIWATNNSVKANFTATANKTKNLSMIPQDTIQAKNSIYWGQEKSWILVDDERVRDFNAREIDFNS